MLVLAPSTAPIKLNLGCGADWREGYVNVDVHGKCFRHDLTSVPWPWAENSVSEVLMHHVLEHLPNTVLVMKELYRVCHDGALVHIAVPHPRHDDFISDPTHVSPITHRTLELFSRNHPPGTDTPLARIHNVDFECVSNSYVVDGRWANRGLSEDQLREAIVNFNNVVKQIEVTLRVRKN